MIYENPWIYNGLPFDDEDIPEGTVGFVYLITLPDDRKYIGKKQLISNRKKIIKGKSKRVQTKSDWQDYYGSSEEMKAYVKQVGKEKFKREILHLCKDKSSLSYMETKEIFLRDALLKDEYVNKWLTAKINGRNLNSLKYLL